MTTTTATRAAIDFLGLFERVGATTEVRLTRDQYVLLQRVIEQLREGMPGDHLILLLLSSGEDVLGLYHVPYREAWSTHRNLEWWLQHGTHRSLLRKTPGLAEPVSVVIGLTLMGAHAALIEIRPNDDFTVSPFPR